MGVWTAIEAVCACIYIYIYIYVCVCVCVYMFMCVYIYIYIYIFKALRALRPAPFLLCCVPRGHGRKA